MRALASLFWNICLLRAGPQDVPASRELLAVVLGLSVASNLIFVLGRTSPIEALVFVVSALGILLGLVYLLLAVFGYRERSLQTLTALGGSGLVLSVLAVPVLFLALLVPGSANPFAWLLLLLNVWGLVVIAHVLRHALSVHIVQGGLLALGYLYLNIELAEYLLPQAG